MIPREELNEHHEPLSFYRESIVVHLVLEQVSSKLPPHPLRTQYCVEKYKVIGEHLIRWQDENDPLSVFHRSSRFLNAPG